MNYDHDYNYTLEVSNSNGNSVQVILAENFQNKYIIEIVKTFRRKTVSRYYILRALLRDMVFSYEINLNKLLNSRTVYVFIVFICWW